MSFHQDRGGPRGGMTPGQHSSPQNYRPGNLRPPPPQPPASPYHYDSQTPPSSGYHGNYLPPHSDFMQYPPPASSHTLHLCYSLPTCLLSSTIPPPTLRWSLKDSFLDQTFYLVIIVIHFCSSCFLLWLVFFFRLPLLFSNFCLCFYHLLLLPSCPVSPRKL